MKRIICLFIIIVFLFNISYTHAQYNISYSKADTLIIPSGYKYNFSYVGSVLKIVGVTILGVGAAMVISGGIGDKGSNNSGVLGAIIVGGVGGLVAGFLESDLELKFKNKLGHNVEGLTAQYKRVNSYEKKVLIAYELALKGDGTAYKFIINEFNKLSGEPPSSFLWKSKTLKRIEFKNNLAKACALAVITNKFNLEPFQIKDLSLSEKIDILKNIPFYVNIIPMKYAVNSLRFETEVIRKEERNNNYCISDGFYEMIVSYLLTRRNQNDFNNLANLYKSEKNQSMKFWYAFALSYYGYETVVSYLMDSYSKSDNEEFRFYSLKALSEFDTPEIRQLMHTVNHNLKKSLSENDILIQDRIIIRETIELSDNYIAEHKNQR